MTPQRWRVLLSDILDQVIVRRDTQSESQLVGALITDPRRVDEVSIVVRGSDFYDSDIGRIYSAIVDLYELRFPVGDVSLLARELKRLGLVGKDKLGIKAADIAKWANGSVPSSAMFYAHKILVDSQIRMQLTVVTDSIQDLVDGREPPDEAARKLLSRIETIYARSSVDIVPIDKAGDKAIDELEEALKKERSAGISTSLHSLDDILGGLFPSELIILAARPGIGKTALAMQMAHHAAIQGHNVLFVSLEMRDVELAMRVICGASGVNGRHVRQGTTRADEIVRMRQANEYLRSISLGIYAPADATVRQIRAAMKQASIVRPVEMVVIDYLQLVEPEDRRATRADQVAGISRSLKQLAKEFNVPMLTLCQLNRDAEGKVPELSHLRESGSIEQDADVVMAIHRPGDEGDNKAQVIVLKQRQGKVGTIDFIWRPEATMFEEDIAPTF